MGFPLKLRSELVLRISCCLALAACGSGSDGTASPAAAGAAGTGTVGASGAPNTPSAGSPGVAGTRDTASGGASSGSPGVGGSPAGDSSAGSSQAGSPAAAGNTASGGSSASGGSGNSAGHGGSSAGASGGGAPSCGSAIFCDGFERAALGADWTIDNAVPANTVEVVADKAHSGSSSVHMKFTTTLGATFIHEAKGFPAPSNSLWGRVWLYVSTPTTSTGHDVYIEASDGKQTTDHGVRPLNTASGTIEINISPTTVGGSGETTAHTTKALPRGAWTCFEWQIAATANSGSVTLYMDGTQLANVPKVGVPDLVYMRVGYEHYTADSAGGELWIDDYALGTIRLNCN